jgi:hypothetical protein
MMYLTTCPQCSAKLPADANFCRRCGAVMRVPPPLVHPMPVAGIGPLTSPVPRRKAAAKKSSGGGFWALLVLAWLGFRFYNTPQPKPLAPVTLPPATWTPRPPPQVTSPRNQGLILPLGPVPTTRPSR